MSTEKIRELNDQFRRTFTGGKVMMTRGVAALPQPTCAKLLHAVRTFDAFTEDNDPHGEHDFGAIEVDGIKCYFKLDYYDKKLEYGSEDPANPDMTTRVMTVMLVEEY